MITTSTYPTPVLLRGLVLRYVQCSHCQEHVFLTGDDRLEMHEDPEPPVRTCEGSGRFYFHMFGTRMGVER